ncbi:sigma-70 family RNA polymerase sigma factor [Methylopila turkensis]|uniref:RNA polymerase sigma factor n=1 Tax=Methylopila turkensis TaxID=1437816 RepID=A0A9W6JMP1_9HYPH|nr:sigma-70 family RNA polymerase sigma factor [Methylopila turkensis]GLK78650.1 RNA polymerase sigma factor [Methylopila turkensis]
MNEREGDWAAWLAAAEAGDASSYRRLLEELAGFLRGVLRRRASAYRLGADDVEDALQEALLAIHLKRGTWDPAQPVGPWAATIARNKLIDSLRRRGRRVDVPIDELAEVLPAPAEDDGLTPRETEKLIGVLKGRQHDVVKAISLDGDDIRSTAARYGMSEGAVRVALHRGLSALSAAYRSFRE